MEKLCKISSVFLNLLNLAAGIAVAVILIFKQDFAAVIVFEGMSRNMILFLNLMLFQVGVTLLLMVITMLLNNPVEEITFPVLYMVLPAVVGVIGIYFGIVGSTPIEKAVVIACSIAYVVLSGVLIYFSTKLFEGFAKKK